MANYKIPLSSQPQTFLIDLAGQTYQLTLQWRDHDQGGWFIDIASTSAPIINSIPLVTGLDLLGQYKHLGIGGSLVVMSDGDPLQPPTYDSLGTSSFLYFVTQ